jgi:Xaa-Pro aminopeptidase
LKQKGYSAIFLTDQTNIYYLTGFRGINPIERESTALVTQDEVHLFIPSMYKAQAENSIFGEVRIHVINSGIEFYSKAKEIVKDQKTAFESRDIKYFEFEIINLPNFHPEQNLVQQIRLIKDEKEIKNIKKAVEITDMAFDYFLKNFKTGMKENEVARMLRNFMEENGAEDMAFDPIVASGVGSASPHHATSEKVIGDGALLIDMGARFQGYNGDLTRTVFVGEPDQKFINYYNLLNKIVDEVTVQIKSGVSVRDLWNILQDNLGSDIKYMLHSLGHGVGLEIHEQPSLNPHNPANLETNMIITIEPGIYIENWGGIRIEDYILVGEDNAEVLSRADRKLICL